MTVFRRHQHALDRLAWLILSVSLITPSGTARAAEERFAVLQTKTAAYTNVTVTTKAKNYVFILHSSGMTNLKITELPLEIQQQLGYVAADGAKGATNTATAWVKREMHRINLPQVKALGQQLDHKWRGDAPGGVAALRLISARLIWAVLGVMLLLYLFVCYCCMLICQKTAHPPGLLVWLPVLQLLPLLRAAGMSRWWFLAYFVPLLNLVPTILWPFKIAKARAKSAWVGVLLLLPVTNLFAFLYLAFSNSKPAEDKEPPAYQSMALETA